MDELDKRRQDVEEKERRRKANKRKRDEQEAKERVVQRKLIQEGKISVEDTWGKVNASQPRLNMFFSKGRVNQRPKDENSTTETSKNQSPQRKDHAKTSSIQDQNESDCDSQEDTLVDRTAIANEILVDELSDADLLEILSSATPPESNCASAPPQNVLPASSRNKSRLPLAPTSSNTENSKQNSRCADFMTKRKRKAGPEEDQDVSAPELLVQTPAWKSPPKNFKVYQDASAELMDTTPPTTEITGDEAEKLIYKRGDRAGKVGTPMKVMTAKEIFAEAKELVKRGNLPNSNIDSTMTSFDQFAALYKAEGRRNARPDRRGVADLETEDRELTCMIEERAEALSTDAQRVEDSVLARGADMALKADAQSPQTKSLKPGADEVDNRSHSSSTPRKRTKTYHFSDSTPGRLPQIPDLAINNDARDPVSVIDMPYSDSDGKMNETHDSMEFDDGGIDDTTLAALPEVEIEEEHTIQRPSGRFIDMDVAPPPAPIFRPTTQPSQSFTSIEDEDFFAAEEAAGVASGPASQRDNGGVISTQDALDLAFADFEMEL